MVSFLKRNLPAYISAIAIVVAVKLIYDGASSCDLDWILAPTARWAGLLCGVKFAYSPDAGYINHDIKFIIAPVCSGVRFMIIAFCAVFFSYVHRAPVHSAAFMWLGGSFTASYLTTVFVNGVRIALSVQLMNADLGGGWLTHERLHLIIGVLIYFISLLLIYLAAGRVSASLFAKPASTAPAITKPSSISIAVFWYLAVVVGVPMINNIIRNGGGNFLEYSVIVTATCLAALSIIFFMRYIKRRIKTNYLS